MKEIIRTYDDVYVSPTAYVWAITHTGESIVKGRAQSFDSEQLVFSTREACQAYIDKMNGVTQPIIIPNDNNYQLNVGGVTDPNPMYMQMYGRLNREIVKDNPTHTNSSLHSILTQFSEAYKIPINDILEFIVNQKSNTLKELNEKKETN